VRSALKCDIWFLLLDHYDLVIIIIDALPMTHVYSVRVCSTKGRAVRAA